jgi:hypothetical protein
LRGSWILVWGILIAGLVYAADDGSTSQTGAATASPLARDLPPCPLSVPCRVEEEKADQPVVSDTTQKAVQKTLLPCPMSVPCIVEEGQQINLPQAVANKHQASQPRRLALRVTSSADTNEVGRNVPGAGLTEEPMPAPPSPAAKTGPPSNPPVAVSSASSASAPAPPDARKVAIGSGIRPSGPSEAATSSATPVTMAKEETPSLMPSAGTRSDSKDLKSQAERAERELDGRLVAVDASKFTLDEARTYNEASGLAQSSRVAMKHGDYSAALSLTKKATQLAEAVVANQKSAR